MIDPKVFIIILNWNGLQDTLECLESVFNLNYSHFTVMVVDNGSTDGSAKVIRKTYPQVILLESKKNLGYTGGNNIAMHYAMEHGANYMWLLNNDTVVEPDTLIKLVETAEGNPEAGLISPVIYYYDAPDKIQFCGSYVDWKNQTIINPPIKSPHVHTDFKTGENVCLWGTALLIKRNLVEKLGYIDERFFAYWEDTEYSFRVLKAGFRNLLCDSAKIYHKTQLSEYGYIRNGYVYYYISRNRYLLFNEYLKDFGRLSLLGNYFSTVLMILLLRNKSNDSEGAEACLDGVWAALRKINGPWDKSVKMPNWLKKIFYFLSFWHPLFWAMLLRGEFSNIVTEILKRTKRKILR